MEQGNNIVSGIEVNKPMSSLRSFVLTISWIVYILIAIVIFGSTLGAIYLSHKVPSLFEGIFLFLINFVPLIIIIEITRKFSKVNDTVIIKDVDTSNNEIKKPLPVLLVIVIVLSWLVYLPCAAFVLGMTGAGISSGNMSSTDWVTALLVNIFPLVVMIAASRVAFKRKSVLVACIPFILLQMVFFFTI